MNVQAQTDGIVALATAARGSRLAASVLRWTAACAVSFASLLVLSVALAEVDRTRPTAAAPPSASAYLDFDLAVLRGLAQRSLEAKDRDHVLRGMWASRPPWRPPAIADEGSHLVSLRDAWAAAVAGKSRFRSAARGAYDALGLLLCGLSLALVAAGIAGAIAEGIRAGRMTARPAGRIATGASTAALVVLPLAPLFDPALFYDRTRSIGAGSAAALFVAGFAGAMAGAAARSLFGPPPQAAHLSALGARPALFCAARLSVLDATRWLVPLVPALAAAAVFAGAKADQDPALHAASSGLGSLIRAAMAEMSAGDRLSSAALVGGALVVLWYLGHRFVAEVRWSLSASGSAT
jgi:hypothetical protein